MPTFAKRTYRVSKTHFAHRRGISLARRANIAADCLSGQSAFSAVFPFVVFNFVDRVGVVETVAELFREGERREVRRVPRRVKSALYTFEDKMSGEGGGEVTPAVIRMGRDLYLDPSRVIGEGRAARRGRIAEESHEAEPAAFVIFIGRIL